MLSYHPSLRSSDEIREQYRRHMNSHDLSVKEVDALIDVVYTILSHFVDQAFCVQDRSNNCGIRQQELQCATVSCYDQPLSHNPNGGDPQQWR